MSRYLITGGAGFIGSHLCERFLDQGHEVLCMDNYSTGAKANIGRFLKNSRFRFIDHNVSRYI
ncbi:MAG TPA: NAD-dependent epimerase/dehydratase family protein, partial [Terriglobales bacterium]|nr:NAD-dependent epimerase/dehydratase family protein [Terriglobales bacterium]